MAFSSLCVIVQEVSVSLAESEQSSTEWVVHSFEQMSHLQNLNSFQIFHSDALADWHLLLELNLSSVGSVSATRLSLE